MFILPIFILTSRDDETNPIEELRDLDRRPCHLALNRNLQVLGNMVLDPCEQFRPRQ